MDNVRELRLDIDEHELPEEWKGQAALMLDYGIQLADAMQEEDEARAALDVAKAKLDGQIRANPGAYDVSKVTEASVTAAILTQPAYTAAEKRKATATHAKRLLSAAVDAIGHRKSALQGLTDLFLKQWHADPKAPSQPHQLREAVEEHVKVIPGRKVRDPKKRN